MYLISKRKIKEVAINSPSAQIESSKYISCQKEPELLEAMTNSKPGWQIQEPARTRQVRQRGNGQRCDFMVAASGAGLESLPFCKNGLIPV